MEPQIYRFQKQVSLSSLAAPWMSHVALAQVSLITMAFCVVAPETEGLMNVWTEIEKPGGAGDVIVAQNGDDPQQKEVALRRRTV